MALILDPEYYKGYNAGLREGARKAKSAVAVEFVDRLQELRNTKGIGPKTWDKIIDCLDINKED